jgi:transglutaminase-like putative cysteine protease
MTSSTQQSVRVRGLVSSLLALAPLAALAALELWPSLATLVLVPATLTGAAVGLTHWNARRTARRGGAADVDHCEPSRVPIGAALALGLFVATLVLMAGADAGHATFTRLTREAPAAESEDAANEAAADPADRAPGMRTAASDALDDMLDFVAEGSGSLVSDAEVLWVRSVSPAHEDPVIYLRHLVLDRLAPEGIVASNRRAPRTRRDADDGARDGWVHLGVAPEGVPVHTYSIEARPLTLGTRRWTILPLPTPALSVALEPVRYSSDGPSVYDGLQRGVFTYECNAALVRTTQRELEQRPCVAPGSIGPFDANERYLVLPPDSPALRVLALHARRATRGADNDVERVLAIAATLQAFDYSLESSGFRGVDALADFVERRRGHCTEFAGAAMVMLRLVGVPARVAVGFMATRAPHGGWVARERNAHAWLEVPFEGLGWLTFDPTPSVGRADGAAGRWTPLSDEPAANSPEGAEPASWLDDAADAWGAWRAGDLGLAAALRGLADALPAGWVVALLVLSAAAATVWLGLRRRGPSGVTGERASAANRRPACASDLHARLSAELRAHGQPRPRAVTLASHAAALVCQERAPEMLPDLVQWAYQERYGPGLDETESAAAEALTASASERLRARNTV